MAYKKRTKKADVEEEWMTTFADSVTLLMCFFIMILNISDPKPTLFDEMRQGLMAEFSSEQKQDANASQTMVQLIEQLIMKHKASKDITMEDTGNGTQLDFTDTALFAAGSATITDAAKPMLDDLVIELSRFEYDQYRIIIEGHTDDQDPPAGSGFPSNWELSSARAAAVVRYFIAKGFKPNRMTASGYADTLPKRPNKDGYGNPIEENRIANRRISIVLERE